jgi:hypothetical protein
MQEVGCDAQLVWQRKISHDIQPIGGVLARPFGPGPPVAPMLTGSKMAFDPFWARVGSSALAHAKTANKPARMVAESKASAK